MSDPLAGGLVGFQTSNKDIDFGWGSARDEEQFRQRLTRNLQQIDAGIHNFFAWNPRQTLDLEYAFFGGIIDTGGAWLVIPNGTVTLDDDDVNFVERVTLTGIVLVNQTGFNYPDSVPMAEITTRNGQISDYIDRRPELGGATGAGGGAINFFQILGQILPSQVPEDAVTQHEAALSIAFTQLTGQIANAQVPEDAVTQHEAALSILVTQLVGILARSQLPPEIAYEDEANIFTLLNTFLLGIHLDSVGSALIRIDRGTPANTALVAFRTGNDASTQWIVGKAGSADANEDDLVLAFENFATIRMSLEGITGYVGFGTVTPEQKLHVLEIDILSISIADGHAAAFVSEPIYNAAAALLVNRHNYWKIKNPVLGGAGPALLDDACVMEFDADAGVHKALTKNEFKINVDGVLRYVPFTNSPGFEDAALFASR